MAPGARAAGSVFSGRRPARPPPFTASCAATGHAVARWALQSPGNRWPPHPPPPRFPGLRQGAASAPTLPQPQETIHDASKRHHDHVPAPRRQRTVATRHPGKDRRRARGGRHPEWWGLNDQIRGVADRLARCGYLALVPDLYRGKSTVEAEEAHHLMSGLDFGDAASQDIAGAVQYLKTRASRVAITGFCMGGALTLLALGQNPDPPPAWHGTACRRSNTSTPPRSACR